MVYELLCSQIKSGEEGMVSIMKSRAKDLEITVNFNIGIKAGSIELSNERSDNPRKNNEVYKDVDASCNFNIKFGADEYEDEIDLKELTEALNTLVNKSVSEVKEKIEEQKTTEEPVEKNSATDSSEEPYSDDIDGDEIANLMC